MKYLSNDSKILTSKGRVLTAVANIPKVKWFWNEDAPIYGIGNNTLKPYNCWCPNNLQYDKTRNRFVFVQCHKQSHAGNNYIAATMHIVYPDDILKKTDITIPSIIGIANLVILDDGTYLLYPKTTEAIRYISTDGGATWNSQSINADLHHVFGMYYCNGAFYGGCDSAWGEYHYSEDGINWQTKSIGADESDYVMRTKEHSFCYWDGHVYAFGRRDWYDEQAHLIEDRNDCSVVYRLDGDDWTVIDDSSLLAFQSNCSPFVFEEGIAIAHINRTSSNPTLYYTVYNGQTFTTKQVFDNLGALSGQQQEFTTPSLAFGNGYACIACSIWVNLNPLGSGGCINTMFVGTYEEKTTKKYFEHESGFLDVNVAKMFNETPDVFAFYPSGAESNITWRWNTSNYDTIVNNNSYKVYFHFASYPCLFMRLLSNSSWYPVYDGKFVDFSILGGLTTSAITHNWLMDYDGRHFAIGGRGQDGDYSGDFVNVTHRFVIDCNLVNASTQPTADLSGLPDGTIVRTISANGGTVDNDNKGTGRYLTFIEQ